MITGRSWFRTAGNVGVHNNPYVNWTRLFAPFELAGKNYVAAITVQMEGGSKGVYTVESLETSIYALPNDGISQGSSSASSPSAPASSGNAILTPEILSYFVGDVNVTNPSIGKR